MMKAVAFEEYGTVDVLKVVELPRPEPRAGEVLIAVRAAAVNPADPKWRAGMFQSFAPVTFPHILGYDVAGIVESVGPDVSEHGPGDAVFALLDSATKGGYAQFVAVPASCVVAIPEGLDFATAAALPTAGLTGVQMVEEHADVQNGQLVLITGAVGSVGRFAVHAARGRGARVVAAVRSNQAEAARALGAADILVLGTDTWFGDPFDCVMDTVGGEPVARLCRHLSKNGTIFTAATNPIPDEGLAAKPVFVAVHQDTTRLARLARAVEAGDLTVPIAQMLPLSRFKEAQSLVERGGNPGKVILEP